MQLRSLRSICSFRSFSASLGEWVLNTLYSRLTWLRHWGWTLIRTLLHACIWGGLPTAASWNCSRCAWPPDTVRLAFFLIFFLLFQVISSDACVDHNSTKEKTALLISRVLSFSLPSAASYSVAPSSPVVSWGSCRAHLVFLPSGPLSCTDCCLTFKNYVFICCVWFLVVEGRGLIKDGSRGLWAIFQPVSGPRLWPLSLPPSPVHFRSPAVFSCPKPAMLISPYTILRPKDLTPVFVSLFPLTSDLTINDTSQRSLPWQPNAVDFTYRPCVLWPD